MRDMEEEVEGRRREVREWDEVGVSEQGGTSRAVGAVQRALERKRGRSVRMRRCSVQAVATCSSHLRVVRKTHARGKENTLESVPGEVQGLAPVAKEVHETVDGEEGREGDFDEIRVALRKVGLGSFCIHR